MRQIEEWRETEPLRFADRDDAILPQYAIQRLWQIVRDRGQLDDTIVTTGVGQHQMWAAQYFHFNPPRNWLTSGGLGTMGFGLPAAIGAQAAHPGQDRHRHRRRRQLPDEHPGTGLLLHARSCRSRCCCLNNQHLGMVVQWEDRFHGGNRAHTYLGAGHDEEPYPDFVTLAKGFRCGARRISRQGRPRRRPGGDARQQGAVRARRAWCRIRSTSCR